MPSRLLSALHRHPSLSRPRRRAAEAPQRPDVEARAADATPECVALAVRAAARPKPRRGRTPSCVKVASRFRYTSDRDCEVVPLLRLSGHWLEKHGFSIEGEVYVDASQGRLILTNYATHMAKVGSRWRDALPPRQASRAGERRTPPGERRSRSERHAARACGALFLASRRQLFRRRSPADFRRYVGAVFPWNTRSKA
jgi:hypothetical protein